MLEQGSRNYHVQRRKQVHQIILQKVLHHHVRKEILEAVRDQGIPRADQVELLHAGLSEIALDYYYESIRGICNLIDEAFKASGTRFQSLQHQAQARSYLKKLTIHNIMKERNCSQVLEFEIAHERILNTVPSCSREYQNDSHYCDLRE